MKNIKLYEDFKEGENKLGDFYSKFWIKELNSEFGDTVVDEYKNIEPLYGGGTISAIGYKSTIKNNPYISAIIIEGITINGAMVDPSIIVFDKRDMGIFHGALIIDYTKIDTHTNNIQKVIESAKKSIEEHKFS